MRLDQKNIKFGALPTICVNVKVLVLWNLYLYNNVKNQMDETDTGASGNREIYSATNEESQ